MTAATDPRSGAAAGGSGAGLGLSKTSLQPPRLVSSHPAEVVLRRLSRLRRNILGAAQLHSLADNGRRPDRAWFVTLTYRPGCDWRADHVSAAVQAFRKWCARQGVPCRYEWVAELQNRGAVHYHLVAWLPRRLSMPKWDTQRTPAGALWWPHGASNRKATKGHAGYLAKYISKGGEFARFPKGCRLYGIGGLPGDGRSVRAWWNLPEWARRLHGVGEVVRRAGALVVRRTGQVLEPRFAVCRVHGGFVVRNVVELAARFHDGPWSSWRPAAQALEA